MKTISRISLPERVTYNGREYTYNAELSGKLAARTIYASDIARGLIVEVLPRNLRGRTDLHGQPYKPSVHVFTCAPLYKIVKVFRVSARREVLRRGITDVELARDIVRGHKSSSRSMVVYFAY